MNALPVSLLFDVLLLFACPVAAGLLVRYAVRGVKRGSFMRRDGTRLRRETSPRAYAFEVVAVVVLVLVLAGLGLRAAARLFATLD